MKLISSALLAILLSSNFAFGVDATIEVVKRNFYVPKVLVEDYTSSEVDTRLKVKINKLIVGDLTVSGHMKPVGAKRISTFDTHTDYEANQEDKIDLVLKYKVQLVSSKELDIVVNLFDVNNNQIVYSKTYSTSQKARYPFLVHSLSIDLNNHLNAPRIDWMQRFVIFSQYRSAKESDIIIADYTLSYQKTIIKGGLNIFPKWADKSQQNFYYTKANSKPTLYKTNIYTGKQKKILSSDGMIVASDVSDDEDELLVTMAPTDQTDIYLYNVKRKKLKQLTTYSGIDVNGNFIDNDKRIVFVSDRLGAPNVFAKAINKKGAEILVHHGRNNNSATTFGNYIIYVSREKKDDTGSNTFNLYMVSTKTDYIRALTSSGRNQFPKFSVDGESVIYLKQYGNQSSLGIIRLNYNESYLFPLSKGKIQSIDW